MKKQLLQCCLLALMPALFACDGGPRAGDPCLMASNPLFSTCCADSSHLLRCTAPSADANPVLVEEVCNITVVDNNTSDEWGKQMACYCRDALYRAHNSCQ